jgi:hypothetical protein
MATLAGRPSFNNAAVSDTPITKDHPAAYPPPVANVLARWLVHRATYGILATTSVHLKGMAFGNVISFADGTVENKTVGTVDNSTGNLYFFTSPLDTSMYVS